MRKSWIIGSVVCLAIWNAWAAQSKPGTTDAQYFGSKPGSLATVRARVAASDAETTKTVKRLAKDADALLSHPAPTVMEKEKVPPSGDKHDYMSLAPYFWPDPNSKDGLPYVRHDGKVNPESHDPKLNDSPAVTKMGDGVETMALAYYFTGDEKFAAGAAKFSRAWFLDPATRMNPNFKFAQAVLGKNDGRGTGILEARHIAIAVDAMQLLAGSKSWMAEDDNALLQWAGAFLDWLLTSPSGQDEHAAKNNHGTWFDVQTARLALRLGRLDVAKRIIEEAKQRRITLQIQPDGTQPLELARTNSFSYSRFNLEALCELATLGEYAGVDLWRFSTTDGRSIRTAMNYMLPYVDMPPKPWPGQQLKEKRDADFAQVLREAALAYPDAGFAAVLAKYPDISSKRFQLLFFKKPG